MTSNRFFRNAIVRSVIATLAVAIWTLGFDGPGWAWALLVGYIVMTFGLAFYLNNMLKQAQQKADKK